MDTHFPYSLSLYALLNGPPCLCISISHYLYVYVCMHFPLLSLTASLSLCLYVCACVPPSLPISQNISPPSLYLPHYPSLHESLSSSPPSSISHCFSPLALSLPDNLYICVCVCVCVCVSLLPLYISMCVCLSLPHFPYIITFL